MRSLGALILSLGLFACGGGSKPSAVQPAEESNSSLEGAQEDPGMPVENEQCCCDYILEGGEGDTMHEEQTFELMSAGECDTNSGACVEDVAACTAE